MLKQTALILALTSTNALADLSVRFDEGAPKDLFTLTNTGDCVLPAAQVTLDLGTAPAGLIFDVTGSGAGVQVFQPFELIAGAEHLSSTPSVLDGDSAIQLNLNGLGIGQSIAFTIDVDDTAGGREITVSGSEIAGAQVTAQIDQQLQTGTFSDRATALIKLAGCTS